MDGKLEPANQMVEGYSISGLPFKVLSQKFHNHEFQGYHLRNKHDRHVKTQMISLMITVKPGIREKRDWLRIRESECLGQQDQCFTAQK